VVDPYDNKTKEGCDHGRSDGCLQWIGREKPAFSERLGQSGGYLGF